MHGRSSKRYWSKVAFLFVLALGRQALAAPPDAATIFNKMKAALEPAKPSIRTITFTVHSAAYGENTKIVARQARKVFPDGQRSVTLVISPETLKGVTFLVMDQKGRPNPQYLYLPALRRVRRISGPGSFEPFLHSDFTYADVGLVETSDRSLKLLATKDRDGTKAYELLETPRQSWYYSRVVDWIAVDSGFPLERDNYDPANELWRKQVYEDVATVDGVPTPMHVRVDDVQTHDWSDYRLDDLHYDVTIPDDIFDPDKLPDVLTSPLWSAR
jgi:Outer membrane lipoprotein-sorting protein